VLLLRQMVDRVQRHHAIKNIRLEWQVGDVRHNVQPMIPNSFTRLFKRRVGDIGAQPVLVALRVFHVGRVLYRTRTGIQQDAPGRLYVAADPPVMLMDEPFGAVDPIARERLQNEFLGLQEDLAKTILFVTHDIDEAIIMADRAVIMAGSPGSIVHELDVALPDPRDRHDPAVQALRTRLMSTFQEAAHVKGGAEAMEAAH